MLSRIARLRLAAEHLLVQRQDIGFYVCRRTLFLDILQPRQLASFLDASVHICILCV